MNFFSLKQEHGLNKSGNFCIVLRLKRHTEAINKCVSIKIELDICLAL